MVLNFTNDLNEIKSALTDCADDFFNQSYNNPKDIERFSQKFSQFANVVIAIAEGKTAGFIAFYTNSETKVGYISMIIVKKEYQGMGVGSELLDAMKKDCVKKSMDSILLEVASKNDSAKKFYCAKGFEKEREDNGSEFYRIKL